MTKYLLAFLLIAGPARAEEPKWPGDTVTDEMRAEAYDALRLAYIMNGFSMSRWGSVEPPKIYGYPPHAVKPLRVIPTEKKR